MTTNLKPVPPVVEIQPRTAGSVELPSRGKFYGAACPDGIVEMFPMTGREEALVSGMGASNITTIFDTLLKRCMKTGPPVEELLTSDRFYLLFVLRSNSYGEDYTFTTKCPSCSARVNHTSKVPSDFKILWAKDEWAEPFSVTLPRSQATVQFRLLRGKDEAEILQYARREEAKARLEDPSFIYRLAKALVTINGKTPEIQTAMTFIENLIGEDCSALKNAIDDVTPGAVTGVDITCTNGRCGDFFRVDLPFTGDFFRTQRRGA